MIKGQELFNEVFADLLEDNRIYLATIEDIDGVTCFTEENCYIDEWYAYYTYSFRYQGTKYSFEMRDHVADNVCDREYYMNTFQEVIERDNALHSDINRIIKYIENESYGTWEEIVSDLENLKRNHKE